MSQRERTENNMFLAKYKDADGKECFNLYIDYERFYRDTFSPVCEVLDICDLSVKGRNDTERKENCIALAKRVQSMDSGGLSYMEYSLLGEFFTRNAKRYGLVREFKENGII